MKSLTQTMAANNEPVDAIGFTDQVDARVLGVATAEPHTVPAGATTVIFSGNADFYVNAFGTATVPAADVTDGSASELNPARRSVVGIATLSLISPAATIVTMSFYK